MIVLYILGVFPEYHITAVSDTHEGEHYSRWSIKSHLRQHDANGPGDPASTEVHEPFHADCVCSCSCLEWW